MQSGDATVITAAYLSVFDRTENRPDSAMTAVDMLDKWKVQYQAGAAGRAWPGEALIRMFLGPYIPALQGVDFKGKSALDVGCGAGNNLWFLGSLGLDLYGSEVAPEICERTTDFLRELGYDCDIRAGTNRTLPFDDGSFDFLVSWNVLHYETNEQDIRTALAEYARVLKSGGRLMLSTTGPDHKILKNAETLGGHRYRLRRSDDFRSGETVFYFDSERYIRHYFKPYFYEIEIGRTRDQIFSETLDWFLVTAVKLDQEQDPAGPERSQT